MDTYKEYLAENVLTEDKIVSRRVSEVPHVTRRVLTTVNAPGHLSTSQSGIECAQQYSEAVSWTLTHIQLSFH